MEFVPKPWKAQHTDEEWAELVLEAMTALDGMDVEDIFSYARHGRCADMGMYLSVTHYVLVCHSL